MGHTGVYGGKAKSKRYVFRRLLKVATEVANFKATYTDFAVAPLTLASTGIEWVKFFSEWVIDWVIDYFLGYPMLWCEIVQIFSWPLTPIKIKRYHFQGRKEGRNVRPSVTHHYVFSIVFPFIFNPFISNNIDRSIYGIKGITLDIFLTKEWLVGKKQLEVFHFLIWPWYQSINQSIINQSINQSTFNLPSEAMLKSYTLRWQLAELVSIGNTQNQADVSSDVSCTLK